MPQRLTTEEFIAKARKVHGYKYDYSKVKYANNQTKVCIICPEHGEFSQTPQVHLTLGCGCPDCGGKHRYTPEDFIAKAREVHGNKYDYSKSVYTKRKANVCIICPEHGEFLQLPHNHLTGHGCPKCCGNIRMTTEEFVARARDVHGDRYDYSKAEYVNLKTPVCIICKKHGEFLQKPNGHLLGRGCQQCGDNRLTTEEFVARAREVHGDRYDYSKVEYINLVTKVTIICPEHGEFTQKPSVHLDGCGCPNCANIKKEYKFNLLQEFKNEYAFRSFLENNDINILLVILRNIEPKYEPIKTDLIRAVKNATVDSPIQVLEKKYKISNDTNEDGYQETETVNSVDLDDIDAVDIMRPNSRTLSPNDFTNNRQNEIEVIGRIEHMLTPEDRVYIMNKFFNDKIRNYIDTL